MAWLAVMVLGFPSGGESVVSDLGESVSKTRPEEKCRCNASSFRSSALIWTKNPSWVFLTSKTRGLPLELVALSCGNVGVGDIGGVGEPLGSGVSSGSRISKGWFLQLRQHC